MWLCAKVMLMQAQEIKLMLNWIITDFYKENTKQIQRGKFSDLIKFF